MTNWSDLRVFLEVVRLGTLMRAAERLGVDDTTVGRRLAALERELGAKLFVKTPDGRQLTPAGEAVRTSAEEMEQAVLRAEQRALGEDRKHAGLVRVATTEVLGSAIVLPAVRALHARHPQIRVELVLGTSRLDVARREADVALRYVRPDNDALVVRRAGGIAFAAYASKEYLAARGRPAKGGGFAGHDVIAFATGIRGWRRDELAGEKLHEAHVVLRANNASCLLDAIRLGLGIGPAPCFLARADRTLERVLPGVPAEVEELWMVVHADVQRTSRVRAVIDALEERLAEMAPELTGDLDAREPKVARRK